MSKLLAARTTPEILKALYEAIWLKRNPGKDYSENRQPPTEAAIASWLPDYPQEARDEANAVLVQVIPDLVNLQWHDSSIWEFLGLIDRQGEGRLAATGFVKGPPREPFKLGTAALDSEGNAIMRPGPAPTEHKDALVLNTQGPDSEVSLTLKIIELPAVHRAWLAIPEGERPKHPLAPLVAARLELAPVTGTANLHRRDRILPARVAMAEKGDRRAGTLFTPASYIISEGPRQLTLPGFGPEIDRKAPALPLLLYSLGGGPGLDRDRAAPLALRLWVESILAVKLEDRAFNRPVDVKEVTLRKLLEQLYPGPRKPRPNEYWPRLMQAIEILDTTRIPWEDPATGTGGLRRIVSVADIPRGPGALDDQVRIIVDLPPGSGVGPVVSPNLAKYGARSAPLYRGLLNLAYLWFEPGKTRRPVRNGKYWLQIADFRRYPKISDDLLIDLFYPTTAQKARRTVASRARQQLPKLLAAGEAQEVKGHLMPPEWMFQDACEWPENSDVP